MIQEGAPGHSLPHRCNMCWNEGNGSCYVTRCGHLFCESCAFRHFGQSQACPTCGHGLDESEIQDLTLGLEPSSVRRIVFEEALKEPNHHSSSQAALRTAELANETLGFLFSQMLLESQRGAEATSLLKGEVAKLKHEQGRVTMQMRNQNAAADQKHREMEHKLRVRTKELVDLQEAYKEKNRKCQAWEKAYANLRSQTTDPSRGGGFTPPESPRAGAMRGPSGSFNGGQGGSMQHQGPPRGVASPGGGGGGGGGLGSAGMPRPGDRIRTNSPHSSNRGIAGYAAGGGRSSRPSWTMPRPNTSRGGSGNGAAGDRVSPMLRPRDGQGHSSHSVTPSPTFSAQQGMSGGRFGPKRPETPLEVRGYYSSRNASPGNRSSGAGGGAGARSSSFFPSSKAGLF
ncbi:unnamed protein product [Ectocarpus sp. 13 AM-2016]